MNTNRPYIKLVFYFSGLMIMTVGVAVSVKSALGVAPISSIPYTITLVSGIDLGVSTMLFSTLMVVLQILLLRKRYDLIHLLQLPIGLVFGAFLTLSGKMTNLFPDFDSFPLHFILMLISTMIIATGVFLYVSSGLVPLPTEGFVLAVSIVTKKAFSTIKVFYDVSMVLISAVTCLIMLHSLGSVGIGTIFAALLVGNEVKILTKLFGRKISSMTGDQGKQIM